MKLKTHLKSWCVVCLSTLPLWATSTEDDALSFSGKSTIDASFDPERKERTLENWTDLRAEYGIYSAELGLTYFEPPRSFSRDTTSPGISFAALEINQNEDILRFGHFRTQLGNGITFRSYRDYAVRWDNNLLGVQWKHNASWWRANAFTGKPRDLEGARYAPVQGAELNLSPFSWMMFGATGLVTQNIQKKEQHVASGLGSLQYFGEKYGASIKGEYAFREQDPKAKALYTAATTILGPINASAEYKDYLNFDISNGAPLNNTPQAAKEHTFSLLARKQLQAGASDIRGFTSEVTYKLPFESQEWVIKGSRTQAENHNSMELFSETFGALEINVGEAGYVLGAGLQTDVEEKHINSVFSANRPLSANYFLKSTFEHQHAQVRLTHKEYYAQIYRLAVAMHRKLTLGVSAERLVEQKAGKTAETVWPGLQADWHVNDKTSLSFFGGMRRAGKDCSGGVCVSKPEFQGIEMIGNITF